MDSSDLLRFLLYVVVAYLAVRWLMTMMIMSRRTHNPGQGGSHRGRRVSTGGVTSASPGSVGQAGENIEKGG